MTPMMFINEFCQGNMEEKEMDDGWTKVYYKGIFCGKYKQDKGFDGERWGVTFDESTV